jgi:hypothetical protein
MILLSNSYWLGEDVPCLTYGLRGVIRAGITVITSWNTFNLWCPISNSDVYRCLHLKRIFTLV